MDLGFLIIALFVELFIKTTLFWSDAWDLAIHFVDDIFVPFVLQNIHLIIGYIVFFDSIVLFEYGLISVGSVRFYFHFFLVINFVELSGCSNLGLRMRNCVYVLLNVLYPDRYWDWLVEIHDVPISLAYALIHVAPVMRILPFCTLHCTSK